MKTRTPTFGRDIGVTYFATSALRDMFLAEAGLTFEGSLLLNALTGSSGSAARHELVDVLVAGIKITFEAASKAVELLLDHALGHRTRRHRRGDTTRNASGGPSPVPSPLKASRAGSFQRPHHHGSPPGCEKGTSGHACCASLA
jgi:hypothetical protein